MKQIKRIETNGYYVFTGRSNANSCFIEKLSHAKQFLIYANYFLKGYLKIYDYVITKDGWVLAVKVNSKKVLDEMSSTTVEGHWRIISERIRLFLSTFVRVTNKQKGRTGCLVHSGYERYYFQTSTEAINYIERIRNQQIKLYSKKRKYRGLKTHYKISQKLGKGSVFLCSKELFSNKDVRNNLGEVFANIDLCNLVVQKFVKITKELHSHPNPHLLSLSIP